jgi:RimJ/RimL family protein N-acetyltransferase
VARAPEAGDLDGYRGLFLDPAVEEWLRPAPLKQFKDSEIRAMLNDDEEHWAVHGFGPWAMVEREGGALVGRGGLKWTSVDGKLAIELPWAVRSDRWGRGYATEAALAAVDWARSLEMFEVVALVRPENLASRRVAEKVGMREAKVTLHAGLDHLVFRLEL